MSPLLTTSFSYGLEIKGRLQFHICYLLGYLFLLQVQKIPLTQKSQDGQLIMTQNMVITSSPNSFYRASPFILFPNGKQRCRWVFKVKTKTDGIGFVWDELAKTRFEFPRRVASFVRLHFLNGTLKKEFELFWFTLAMRGS